MGCCDTGFKEPKNNKEDTGDNKSNDSGSMKTIVIWGAGIIILVGLGIWVLK